MRGDISWWLKQSFEYYDYFCDYNIRAHIGVVRANWQFLEVTHMWIRNYIDTSLFGEELLSMNEMI